MAPWLVSRPHIVLFGDHLTEDAFASGGWGGRLQSAYTRRADVLNRGYGGYNTRWAQYVLPHVFPKNSPAPLLVIICFGASDATLPGYPAHVPLGEYGENLESIINHVRNVYGLDTSLLLVTPPPVQEESYRRSSGGAPCDLNNTHTGDYAEECMRVAARKEVVALNLWLLLQDMASRRQDGLDAYLTHGVHLSPLGQQVVFEQVTALVDQALGRLQVDQLPLEFPHVRDIDWRRPSSSFQRPTATTTTTTTTHPHSPPAYTSPKERRSTPSPAVPKPRPRSPVEPKRRVAPAATRGPSRSPGAASRVPGDRPLGTRGSSRRGPTPTGDDMLGRARRSPTPTRSSGTPVVSPSQPVHSSPIERAASPPPMAPVGRSPDQRTPTPPPAATRQTLTTSETNNNRTATSPVPTASTGPPTRSSMDDEMHSPVAPRSPPSSTPTPPPIHTHTSSYSMNRPPTPDMCPSPGSSPSRRTPSPPPPDYASSTVTPPRHTSGLSGGDVATSSRVPNGGSTRARGAANTTAGGSSSLRRQPRAGGPTAYSAAHPKPSAARRVPPPRASMGGAPAPTTTRPRTDTTATDVSQCSFYKEFLQRMSQQE